MGPEKKRLKIYVQRPPILSYYDPWRVHSASSGNNKHQPSGTDSHSDEKLQFMVGFPIRHGDFLVRYVRHYQRVEGTSVAQWIFITTHVEKGMDNIDILRVVEVQTWSNHSLFEKNPGGDNRTSHWSLKDLRYLTISINFCGSHFSDSRPSHSYCLLGQKQKTRAKEILCMFNVHLH